MNLKAKFGLDACAFDHAGETGRGERRASLRCEHESRFGVLLALERRSARS
jgi:hypothetical protein